MVTLEDLIQTQERNADEISRTISNVKKTPKERRSIEYYQKKSKELEELWRNFEKIDNCIRRDSATKEDHPYLVQKIHEIMSQRYREAAGDIERNIQDIKEQEKLQASGSGVASKHAVEAKPTHSMIKMRDATISQILSTLDDMLVTGVQYTKHQLDVKLNQIDYNIKTMQQLQNKLCSENIDHDIHAFLSTQTEITDKLMQIEELKANLTQDSIDNTTVRQESSTHYLPKVTIPKFNGDYLSWQPFYDMFNEMIHRKAMPAIQKMWFLKTNLTGEAARLIQNLSLTETNYETAWKTLQDRFNNPRILTNNIINKFLGQSKLSENPSSAAIKGLHDTTHECLAALNNLNINTSTWDPILVNILLKKLDHGTHVLYEQSIHAPRLLPSLEELLGFLETRFQSLEAVGRTQSAPKRSLSATTTSQENNHCKLCNNGNHQLYYCNMFLSKSVPDRLRWIQQQKLCVNCFKFGHMSKDCTSSSCRKCKKKHNTLLHLDNNQQNIKKQFLSSNETATTSLAQTPTVASAHHPGARKGYVLLATARVKITGTNGRSGVFKAILDSGSQINIVTNRLLNRLSLKPSPTSLCIEGIGNQSRNTNQRINVNLQSTTSDFSTRLEAFVIPNIIPAQPSTEFDHTSWSIPENIQLADPEFSHTSNVDVLLGAEYYLELLTTGKIQLSPELPILKNTRLGWIVSGRLMDNTSHSAICAVYGEGESTTDELIQRFWRLDEFESDSNLSAQEKICEQHFIQTTTRNSEGRFILRLPFKENPSCLGETKGLAYSRLMALERRLSMNAELKRQYVNFMKEYEELGHMTRLNSSEVMTPHFYIPHHCVIKPESKSTKLRVVFDASAKSSTGISLNEILCVGPPTQGDLFGILLRFRMPTYVFCTDIEKMYRQILIDPADRSMQLIHWRNDSNEAVKTYQLNTVTYGTSAAPYLATKCLQQLAEICL